MKAEATTVNPFAVLGKIQNEVERCERLDCCRVGLDRMQQLEKMLDELQSAMVEQQLEHSLALREAKR